MKQENENTPQMEESLLNDIRHLLEEARRHVYRMANSAMVQTNWHVGRMIVEAQGGEERAAYGDGLLKRISTQLTEEFGKGYDYSNLRKMRQFYLYFQNWDSVSLKLSWTHYRTLLRVSNPKARAYYVEEAAEAMWSVRQLERQIPTPEELQREIARTREQFLMLNGKKSVE